MKQFKLFGKPAEEPITEGTLPNPEATTETVKEDKIK